MRKRHSAGGVRKQRDRWLGLWYENGVKKSRVLGYVSEMSKSAAREAVAQIIASKRSSGDTTAFGDFVEGIFFGFKSRRWKASTREENCQRIRFHLISAYEDRELGSFRRDELQDLLDAKATTLSFSVVDHLKFDLRSIFDMAVAEGKIERNPARLLFTPREAKRPMRRVMTIEQVQTCFAVLAPRERLIAKCCLLVGLRPGEVFGLRWDQLGANFADIRQRVYRGTVDTPKTDHSFRKAALADRLVAEIEAWRSVAVDPRGWVFPSEAGTPLSKDNVYRRCMKERLAAAGLDWVNFQVMRRTHATLMKQLGADPKLVADQLGHTVDVNQNCYTQTSVTSRVEIVNLLESSVLVVQ